MHITKYGHSCLLVEEGAARILIDPGSYSSVPEGTRLDAIFITHTHFDHLDPVLIKRLLAENPEARVISCAEVGKVLEEEGINHAVIEDGDTVDVNGVAVTSVGRTHAYIYGDQPQCQNTGYLIAGRFYYPGDSFRLPGVPVELLALPTAGPWMKIAECIDFAKGVHPNVVFPVHDGFIREDRIQVTRRFPQAILEGEGIVWKDLNEGDTLTL